MRVRARRVYSVACVSVPRADGNGALGCGRGWTQDVDGPVVCPRCGRHVTITGTYLVAGLADTIDAG